MKSIPALTLRGYPLHKITQHNLTKSNKPKIKTFQSFFLFYLQKKGGGGAQQCYTGHFLRGKTLTKKKIEKVNMISGWRGHPKIRHKVSSPPLRNTCPCQIQAKAASGHRLRPIQPLQAGRHDGCRHK